MNQRDLDQYLDLQREIDRLEIRLEDLKNKKVADKVDVTSRLEEVVG